MPVKKRNEFQISDFVGIQKSKTNPQINACYECKNFDLRENLGDLISRQGYTQKYAAPASADYRAKLGGIVFLQANNFYVPDVGDGQEITVWVMKATLTAETSNGAYSEPDDREIILFFTSHQFIAGESETTADIFSSTTIGLTTKSWVVNKWVGLTVRIVAGLGIGQSKTIISNTAATLTVSTWTTTPDGTSVFVIDDKWMQRNWDGVTTGKYWLNHCILTKIDAIGAVNKWEIELDFVDATIITNNTLLNWSAYNITKNECRSIMNTYDVAAGQVGIKITANIHDWVAGDEIILMRNFIPYNYLIAMGNLTTGANAEDVTFHKILNDLRIGFGGYEDRLGISIGYKEKYWRIVNVEFGSPVINDIITINNIILDVYTGIGQECGIDLETIAGGDLVASTLYKFRLIGILNGFNKILLAENSIKWSSGTYNISVNPKIRWGSHNKQLTNFELYGAQGEDSPFFLLTSYRLSNTENAGADFIIRDNGFLDLETTFSDLHISDNAVLEPVGSTQNTTTGWAAFGNNASIAAVTTVPTPNTGTHSMKITHTYTRNTRAGAEYGITLEPDNNYNFNFVVNSNVALSITIYFVVWINGIKEYKPLKTIFIPAITWTLINETFLALDWNLPPKYEAEIVGVAIDADMLKNSSGGYLAIDDFHLYKETSSSLIINTYLFSNGVDEITDVIGHIPTFNLVKSWDSAFVSQGRTYLVNPYIDRRYLNKIFFSVIVGKSFMYDVIPPDNYYEISNFDGNDLIAAEVLPNLDFAALKKGSNHYIDSNTGLMRLIEYGKGIVSRRGLVNYGRQLIYPGQDDIYLTDGFNAIVDITDGTIREEYRGWSDTEKKGIFAIREEKDNAYRLRRGTGTNEEFIFTKKGWIRRKGINFTGGYILARDNNVWAVTGSGVIYYPDNTNGENGTAITFDWKSVPIDISLISELKNVERFYVLSFWVMYSTKSNQTFNIKIYFDGSGSALDSKVIASGGVVARVKATKVLDVPNKSCRYFQFGIDGSDTKGQQIIIHSLGISWIPAETGIFEK